MRRPSHPRQAMRVQALNLTRVKAGHYLYGAVIIQRYITDDATYWTITEGDKVQQVSNLIEARKLLEASNG